MKMRKGSLFMRNAPVVAAVAMLTTGRAVPAAEDAAGSRGDVLGRIGSVEISAADVDGALAGLDSRERENLAKDPARLNLIVRAYLVQRLVLKEALEKKWDQKPDIVAQLERVRESAITETYLKSLSEPPENYPSEEELRGAYESSKPALLVPRSYRIAQIFVSDPPGGADQAARDKAGQKLERVRKHLAAPGADFAALARVESDDSQSAARGGEIGWLAETQIQPEIRDRLPSLKLNAVSEPVRLDDGWHILKVLDVQEAHTPTFDQIRLKLAQQLRAERTRANTQAHLAALVKQHPVAIDELALAKLLPRPVKP